MSDETIASRIGKAPPPFPTARDVLTVCFRQRRVLGWTFLSVLVLILVYGLLLPSYEAHMEVLLRRGRSHCSKQWVQAYACLPATFRRIGNWWSGQDFFLSPEA